MGKSKKNKPLTSSQRQSYHQAVLLKEALDNLSIKPGGIYVDATFGGGGHSRAILEKLNADGKLIAFDQDEDAKQNVPDDERIVFVPQNFRHLQRFLRLYKIPLVDGILADLGVSSHQFDEADRGFSTRFDAPLDMRMDKRQERTAADVLREMSETELHKLFEKYGEVTNSKSLAKSIVHYRESVPLKTILQFKQALEPMVKGNPNRYFAQVFQALRIEVNDEFGALREMLEQTPSLLRSDGRIAIITFHSLEDRIVKNFFRKGTFEETDSDHVYGIKPESPFHIITKKPILPTAEEIKNNPRARSARLRVAQKR